MWARCRKYVPPGLLAEDDDARHLDTARRLPDYFTNMMGFETYLDRPDAGAGMALFVSTGSAGWQFLSGQRRGAQDNLFRHTAWRRLQRFCALVSRSDSAFYGQVGGLWCEFDVDEYQTLLPDIFVDFQEAPLHGDRGLAAIEQAAAILQAASVSETAPALGRCLRDSSDGSVYNLGFMLSRPLPGVRLVGFASRSLDNIYRYLQKIEWPGSVADLRSTVGWLDGIVDRFVLQVDVAAEIRPLISIELFLDTHGRDRTRWTLFLQNLVDHGLCHPAKRDALLSFPGGTLERGIVPFKLLRALNHAKVVYQPGQSLRGKGYFYFEPIWGGGSKEKGTA